MKVIRDIMQLIDYVTLAIIAFFVALQTIRGSKGMGRIFFEMVGVIVATIISVNWYQGLVNIFGMKDYVAFALLFLITVILMLIIATVLTIYVGWALEGFDTFFSFIFGVVIGWAAAYIFLKSLLLYYGDASEIGLRINESPIGQEILNFRTFQALINLFRKTQVGPDVNPNIG